MPLAGEPLFLSGRNNLGISAYYHDSASCLVEDGEIVAGHGFCRQLAGGEKKQTSIGKHRRSSARSSMAKVLATLAGQPACPCNICSVGGYLNVSCR